MDNTVLREAIEDGKMYLAKNDLYGFYEFVNVTYIRQRGYSEYIVPRLTIFFQNCGIDIIDGLLTQKYPKHSIPANLCYGNNLAIPHQLMPGNVLTIPEGFDMVEKGAFYNCIQIDEIEMENVRIIHPECFAYNALSTVTIGKYLTNFFIKYPLAAAGAFESSTIDVLYVPNGYEQHEDELYNIFEHQELQEIKFYS